MIYRLKIMPAASGCIRWLIAPVIRIIPSD